MNGKNAKQKWNLETLENLVHDRLQSEAEYVTFGANSSIIR
jgi:hypothetical protein